MRFFGALICLVLLRHQLLEAQDVFVVAKAGVSSYGSLYFGPLSGGGGDSHWLPGMIISSGVRLRISEGFGLDGLIEYSRHGYEAGEWDIAPINDPGNRIIELTAFGRSSFRIIHPCHFCFLYGLSVSSQHKDEIVMVNSTSRYAIAPVDDVTCSVILGAGLDVRAPARLEISLEGTLRMRRYVTPVAELGIAYRL